MATNQSSLTYPPTASEFRTCDSGVFWSWRLQQKTAIPYYCACKDHCPKQSFLTYPPRSRNSGPQDQGLGLIKPPTIVESPAGPGPRWAGLATPEFFGVGGCSRKLRFNNYCACRDHCSNQSFLSYPPRSRNSGPPRAGAWD